MPETKLAKPETKNINQALLQAQKAFGPVLKNATNPAFRSKYADLGAVIETITEPLHESGILYSQPLVVIDGEQHIKTVFIHVDSDTSLESLYKVVCKDMTDPQKVGAAITYGRRYSLLSALGLAPEDDDGNSAATPSRSVNTQTGELLEDGPCDHCNAPATAKNFQYSQAKYGRNLCWNCQEKAKSGELGHPNEDLRTQSAGEVYKDGGQLPF